MTGYFAILLTAILTANFVLSKFLGICPFLGVSKKLNTAMGMSAAVIFVMALSTAVCYPINNYILVPNGLEYLQTIVCILVIAALVILVIKKKNDGSGNAPKKKGYQVLNFNDFVKTK